MSSTSPVIPALRNRKGSPGTLGRIAVAKSADHRRIAGSSSPVLSACRYRAGIHHSGPYRSHLLAVRPDPRRRRPRLRLPGSSIDRRFSVRCLKLGLMPLVLCASACCSACAARPWHSDALCGAGPSAMNGYVVAAPMGGRAPLLCCHGHHRRHVVCLNIDSFGRGPGRRFKSPDKACSNRSRAAS